MKERGPGLVSGEGGYHLHRDPDTVRAPDAAWIAFSRLPGGQFPEDSYPDASPNLAVEVMSTHDREIDIDEKVADYLAAGSERVWVVRPRETQRGPAPWHTGKYLEASRYSSGGSIVKYAVVIEDAGANFSAYVPDLPGCVAVGDSLEEVEREIQDAIRFHLDGMIEDGVDPPAAKTIVEYVLAS